MFDLVHRVLLRNLARSVWGLGLSVRVFGASINSLRLQRVKWTSLIKRWIIGRKSLLPLSLGEELKFVTAGWADDRSHGAASVAAPADNSNLKVRVVHASLADIRPGVGGGV